MAFGADAAIAMDRARVTRFSLDVDTTAHTSHAIKLVISLDGNIEARAPGGRLVRAPVVLIPADMVAAAHSRAPAVTVVLDPELNRDAHLAARALAGVAAVEPGVAERLRDAVRAARQSLEEERHLGGLGAELQALAFTRPARPAALDARVERAIEHFHAQFLGGDGHPAAINEALAVRLPRLDVTVQHFRALFLRDVGISPRAWFLWTRLVYAIRLAVSGVSLTSAASAAGFADQAHFSRTCRRLLGYAPRALMHR